MLLIRRPQLTLKSEASMPPSSGRWMSGETLPMIDDTESADPAPTGRPGEDDTEAAAADSAEVADSAAPEKMVALSRDGARDASDVVAD